MITVDKIKKSFAGVDAVKSVSFSAKDGEITGLLGPNGAGKTTTLRMLYSLYQPESGCITVDGMDPMSAPIEVRKKLGALPDSRGLYRHLTARENIRYFGQLHGMSSVELDKRTAELIDLLGIAQIADRRTAGFSQGERVKVAIARAVVHQPQNILLDEPTNGLDVSSTRALRAFLKQQRDSGRCVLFSSHIMQEVMALCDRIVVIAHGLVVADGRADELLEKTGKTDLEDAFVSLVDIDSSSSGNVGAQT